MTFRIHSENRPNTLGLDGTVFLLEDGLGSGCEIWPALGFNCYRWHVHGQEILYADPHFFQENHPTRSGIPVLFPFPNRIRDGRFSWAGKEYQLPRDDPAKKNGIHGIALRHPWRVVDQGTDANSAWVTGEFHAAKDAPADAALWPTDYLLRLTCRFQGRRLRVESEVQNPDRQPLPFGLGYHPYFTVPFGGDVGCKVRVPAARFWELTENLPSGKKLPVTGPLDLRAGREISGLALDDVLTDLETPAGQELVYRGGLEGKTMSLEIWTSPAFREMVIFNPPHGKAICLEPYTCTTDAVNLQAAGVEAGWRVLGPGEKWSGVVEMRV